MCNTKLTLLTLLIFLSAIPSIAQDFEYEGIWYTVLDADTKTVQTRANYFSGSGNNCSGDITIPSIVSDGTNDYIVTAIGHSSFRRCTDLTSIVLPESITSIEMYAFYGCSSLNSINIPDGVTTINNETFCGCSSLESVILPESVTSIRYEAFLGCSGLTTINIPDLVTFIEYNAFYGCSSLTSINIPAGVTSINQSTFYGCSSLSSVVISEGVTSIGTEAFFGCSDLISINFPDGMTSIGERAFSYCSSLSSINFPEGMTSIGAAAFSDCSGLTSINIPEGVTSIENSVFTDCSGLTSINIPESVTSIGIHAFSGCSALTSINIPESVTSIGGHAFSGCSALTSINIPHGVTSIGENSFSNCSELTSVNISTGLNAIERYAFSGCSNLTTINIPDGLTSIGQSAFEDCSSLTSFDIPDGITSIENYTFRNCSSLTTINIPSSVNSIGRLAFYDCSSLNSVILPESVTSIGEDAFYNCSRLASINIPSGVTTIENNVFYRCSSLTSIILPENVTSIGTSAFEYCSNLSSINIPDGVISIGNYAFEGCSGLTSINIPAGVTTIGERVFYGCSGLTSLNIPDWVTTIGEKAFSGCSGLTSINIPASVTSIGENAFSGSDNLEEVNYYATNLIVANENIFIPYGQNLLVLAPVYRNAILHTPNATLETVQASYPWNKFTHIIAKDGSIEPSLPAGSNFEYEGIWYTVIDSDAKTVKTKEGRYDSQSFSTIPGNDCSGNITIPSTVPYGANDYTVTSIGGSSFMSCTELTTIILPESVTSIGGSAFYGCSSLTSINIPDGMTSIGAGAFSDCSSLNTINIPDGVNSIEKYTFNGCSNLTSIDISEGLTAIGEYAFNGCSSLNSINIPDGVTSIEDYVFADCSSLTSINIPDGVTSIGQSAFEGCSSLTSINIPDGVTSIGNYAFEKCSSLSSVNIPDGVTSIERWSFADCSSLSSINIPDGVTSIGDYAFLNCNNLEKVIYSASTPIEASETVFYSYFGNIYGTATLKTPNATLEVVQATEPWNKFSHIIASDGSIGFGPFAGDDFEYEGIWYTVIDAEAKTVKTKDGIADGSSDGIPANQISGELVIPAKVIYSDIEYTVIEIGHTSFQFNYDLTSVSLPNTITTISWDAFYGCNALTEIIIPENVTHIGHGAFYNCTNLSSLTLPAALNEVEYWAFMGCDNLMSVIYDATTPISIDREIFSYEVFDKATLTMPNANLADIQDVEPWRNFKKIIAKDGSIGFVAVGDDFEFEGITYTIISIEEKTCRTKAGSLEGGQYVAGNAVSGDITIPATVSDGNDEYSVIEIGWVGFANCNGLTSISLPSSVSSIPESAFNGCSNLASITLPQSITSIDVNAFLECANLSEITLPEQLTSVGHGAFTGCSRLNSILIPESLTLLQNQVFSGCSSLKSIDLPATLEGIEYGAFFGCDPNVEVRYKASTPIAANENAFSENAYANGTLNTPNATLADVQATVPWNKFLRITASDGSIVPFASEIKLNQTAVELKVGETTTLEATIIPDNVTNNTVVWSSDNEEVATVDANGKITAISLGEATITAQCGEVTASCSVTVIPTPASSIILSQESTQLMVGESVTLSATVLPEDTTDKTITWSSSVGAVATVDAEGKVTAVSLGEATITAQCGEAIASCSVSVIPTPASSITISQSVAQLKVGESVTLSATVLPEDATDKTITWSSSNDAVATVDTEGNVTAISLGDATITAQCGEATASCSVSVIATPASSITISQSTAQLKVGESVTLSATVLPEDTTDKTVTWSSSNPSVATVDADGNVTAISLGESTINATCGEASSTCSVSVVQTPAESISISQSLAQLKVGESVTLSATVLPEDTTEKTITWSSSNPNVATVDADGNVTAISLGESTITAQCGEATASCSVTVIPTPASSLTLNQTSAELKVGESVTLSATVLPEDTTDKTVTWSSSNDAVATVDAGGKVIAIALGETTITASCGDVSASCSLNVVATLGESLSISQETAQLMVGESVTLSATVLPEDTTDKTVIWSSNNEAVATVDAEGNVTAISVGEATITASCGELSANCTVTVIPTPASTITLSQSTAQLKVGDSLILSATVLPEDATDNTVTWTSSNETVATVDSDGHVTAHSLGETIITASCGDVSATCTISVVATLAESISISQENAQLMAGESVTLSATVLPEDATDKTVTWSSSNETVATVDAEGKVTAISVGEAIITASCGNITATCTVSVVPTPASSITLNQTSAELKVGESVTLSASVLPEDTTDKTITWSSNNEAVATVDAQGNVTAISVGEATITASCGDLSANCTVTVIPTPASTITLSQSTAQLKVGDSLILSATVLPEDATDKTVTWTSSNETVAAVDSEGKVTAITLGEATITATCGSVAATCIVTVGATPVSSITLSQSSAELKVGESVTLSATVFPEDATDKTVEWSSSNSAIATVDANGNVTAISIGNATITAHCGDVSATCSVTVTTTPASTITLSQSAAHLQVNETIRLTATVLPEDATEKTVTWTSSNPSVATVDANGLVTAIAIGETTITARCGDVTTTCVVSVVQTPAESVTISQSSAKLNVGESLTLTATVFPDYATDKTVIWESSNSDIAKVYDNGKVTAIAAGEAAITARCGNVTATCIVTVIPNPAGYGEEIEFNGIVYTVIDEESRYLTTKDGSVTDGSIIPGNSFNGNLEIPSSVSDGYYDYTVTEIGSYGFSGSDHLTTVTIPGSIQNIGTDAFSDCVRLTSLIWKGHKSLQSGVVEAIDNPNLLIYVDSVQFAPTSLDHNIVVLNSDEGNPVCENMILQQGHAFRPAIDFVSLNSRLTQDFTQSTIIGESAGWESIVLPFDVRSIYNEKCGELTPFANLTDIYTECPFWLYEGENEGEWKEATGIRAGIPYIISMPNNPEYLDQYNIDGPVTFSNSEPSKINADIASPYAVTWASGQNFSSLWLPLEAVEAENAMGLNVGIDDLVGDDGELLPPGSAFHIGVTPRPLEAYVTRQGSHMAKKIMGDQVGVQTIESINGLDIKAYIGHIIIRSERDRNVDIFSMEGTHIRSVMVQAGKTEIVRDLTRGLYIIAGRKIMVK